MIFLNLYKKIFGSDLGKNLTSLTLIQIANYAIPLLLIPYVSRIVGVDNYGKLEYARTFVFYFTILVDFGFNYTATRDIAVVKNDNKELNKIFSQVIICKVLLLLMSSIIFYYLVFSDPYLIQMKGVLFSTYLINLGFVFFPIWFYQGIEKIAFISILNFIIKIIVLASIVLFLKEKSDYWLYNLFQSISQIIASFLAFTLVFTKYNIKFVTVTFQEVFTRYKEGFAVFVSTLLVAVFASFSFMIMKDYVSDEDLGIYSTAFKLVITIQTLLLVPFSQAFFPYMAKIINQDTNAFKLKIKQASKFILILNVIVILISIIFAKLIIRILFGEDYLSAVTPFRIFAILPLFACLNNLYSYQGLLNMKKDKIFLYIHFLFALITIGCSYIIVPKFGLYGTILLRVFLEVGLFLVSYYNYKKHVKLLV